ncbi:MAG: iron-sulfur cluster insertion protein ErpA [Candidatus Binatia bacterium]|jgi:iron-sulfur cluster assembly accessory protein
MKAQVTVETPQSDQGTGSVLQLTEAAAERVKVALRREGLVDHALRVAVAGGGCSGFQYSLSFDNSVRPGDTMVEQWGVRMVVDATSVQFLHGTTIDYVESLHGAGFKFINPRVTRTCGCGSSFSA